MKWAVAGVNRQGGGTGVSLLLTYPLPFDSSPC